MENGLLFTGSPIGTPSRSVIVDTKPLIARFSPGKQLELEQVQLE